jgi:polypeptide N-acetylgalactosaminyltransferase
VSRNSSAIASANYFNLRCRFKNYLSNLPQTSVIIIFFNEWPSILKRTIHSVYNRTPRGLLKEIILVNDNSTKPELNDELEVYLKENFDERVKMFRLNERKGLIVTRLEGAKYATGEVLVFLDSHIEVNRSVAKFSS